MLAWLASALHRRRRENKRNLIPKKYAPLTAQFQGEHFCLIPAIERMKLYDGLVFLLLFFVNHVHSAVSPFDTVNQRHLLNKPLKDHGKNKVPDGVVVFMVFMILGLSFVLYRELKKAYDRTFGREFDLEKVYASTRYSTRSTKMERKACANPSTCTICVNKLKSEGYTNAADCKTKTKNYHSQLADWIQEAQPKSKSFVSTCHHDNEDSHAVGSTSASEDEESCGTSAKVEESGV
ncbi:hypothetical protein RFI_17672 [Reticulomyxa filosa]|uniref:Uncharacterized protein n=1 Tax=Reticulomyxa filosa TaxID=46433 RepID=X6N0W7_RETFI|nr:hypothetical protein RFI_17672 [Reticulomyxa filosa]|eukprot:ETO19558.1 hypothetical protein RFI_17672 [Reticulomyxa filosa]